MKKLWNDSGGFELALDLPVFVHALLFKTKNVSLNDISLFVNSMHLSDMVAASFFLRAPKDFSGKVGMVKKNIAVCGTGYWGKNLLRNYVEIGALKTIYDSNIETGGHFQKAHPSLVLAKDFDEILADPEIEGIVIATPAETHFGLAEKALLAGKNVFVEKPLALKVSEGEKLVELVDQTKKILFVGHLLHYHPAVIQIKQLIQDGIIGRLQYIHSNRLSLGKVRREENILWSFAPHDISLMLSLVGEQPHFVDSVGSFFLHPQIADVTMSNFKFPSGVSGHIFVSWLNPFKEQRLVVVGGKGMLVFEDSLPLGQKLTLYPHHINWKNGMPLPQKAKEQKIDLSPHWMEPLKKECLAFLEAIETGKQPITDAVEGLQVLRVLDRCQRSIEEKKSTPILPASPSVAPEAPYFVHETALVDAGAIVGKSSKIWHYSHIMKGAILGEKVTIGQNVNVDANAFVGNNVKIQNNVSIYSGVTLEDDVFLGPSCVLTNVSNPRSQVKRHGLYELTRIRRGATVGANATVLCGLTIGRYAFISAGAVVTKDVQDYALIRGNSGKQVGWMSRHGHQLRDRDAEGVYRCPESGFRYKEVEPGTLKCLDLDEEKELPARHRIGKTSYREYKRSQEFEGAVG